MKKWIIATGIALLVLAILFGGFVGLMRWGGQRHTHWHECRDICALFDDAKRICAEQKGLTTDTVVTWQDIQPFFTNSQYWGHGRYDLDPTKIPECPAGGTYTLNPVGYWAMCTVPYHQWDSCKTEDYGDGHGWGRVYVEPNKPTGGDVQ